jgi:hypothetical protein
MTAAERQRTHQTAKRERGLVPVTAPAAAAPEFKRAAELIVVDPDLRIGRMVSAACAASREREMRS